jgi:ketosteroid isomerase-like protein
VETGTFEWTLAPKNGLAAKDKGKYLTVWKRQMDGTWKIVRDINNSDLPAN